MCRMASESDLSSQSPIEVSEVKITSTSEPSNSSAVYSSSVESTPFVVSSSDEAPMFPKPTTPAQNSLPAANTGKWGIARIASGFGLHLAGANGNAGGVPPNSPSVVLQSVGKGLVDTSLGAVKAVQVKARHMVSQNKRRYQVKCTYIFRPGTFFIEKCP